MQEEVSHYSNKIVEQTNQETVSQHAVHIVPPMSAELFFAGHTNDSTLSYEIIGDTEVLKQAKERRNLYQICDRMFSAIPYSQCTIEEAVKKGMVTVSDVVAFWDGISDFLEKDDHHARILLYMPFEMLPESHPDERLSDPMIVSGKRFRDVYRQNWIMLLHQSEPRANFVDGDVLEPGLGEPERISKAGHFTPELLAKGIITQDDIVNLFSCMYHKEFLQSLADGATVSVDRGLIDEFHAESIKAILQEKFDMIFPVSTTRCTDFRDADDPNISFKRALWLRKLEEDHNNEKEAAILSRHILNGLSLHELMQKTPSKEIVALSIIKTGTFLADTDLIKAKAFAYAAEQCIQTLWDSEDAKAKDTLIGGLHRWARLGIISHEFLEHFNIPFTDLSSAMHYDQETYSEEYTWFSTAAKKIQEHPFLAKKIYPVFLLFGSRFKGYADTDADIDAALFFRPDTKFEERMDILEIVRKDIPELSPIDTFLEFWTKKEKEQLQLYMPQEHTRTFVGEDQIHFLMGGIWIGSGDDMKKIRNDILMRYLDISRYGEEKDMVRRRLLGQMELDVLQYRLLHKGYKKFYPRVERGVMPHADLIDWHSDFWDSGYRRVATKLFLSRVFLPDLS